MSTAVLLCAGGTGGHLFPAEALADALRARGVDVDLATDSRAIAFTGSFPARHVHEISSETVRSRSPVAMARTLWKLGRGIVSAWMLLGRVRPAVVVGFGGYPTLPPLLAAARRGIPTLIHEQNAVMGRANRMLARRVTRIATGFPQVEMVDPAARHLLVHTGNPVRPAVIAAAGRGFPSLEGRISLLIFGGSQGARVMSDIVPAAIGRLDAALRARLDIVQQAREEDMPRVRQAYELIGLDVELAPFFKDLPERMAQAHLVIGRGGASTVAELAVIGRPSILVPLPGALDQDQAANARALEETGGAVVMSQSDFTPENLALRLAELFDAPASLAAMAEKARNAGAANAAERLADQVMELASMSKA